MSDVLSRQAKLATEALWSVVHLEKASLRQKSRIWWSKECCQTLQAPIGSEEVRRVLFSMDNVKAPDPHGFFVGFFDGAWSMVEEDFCDAILHFFPNFLSSSWS